METVTQKKPVVSKPKKTKKIKLTKEQKRKQLKKMAGMWQLYALLVLPIIYFLVFQYFPMYGAQIAFKDYLTVEGIWGSPWVGLKHFQRFIDSGMMWTLVKNTLSISLYALFMGLPFPVMLSLLFRYIPLKRYGKFIQSVTYAPHFISTVVMAGIIVEALNPRGGMLDTMLGLFGIDWEINLMGMPDAFSSVYVWSGIWQNMGFGAILYCAVLAGVDNSYHEAAMVDGATLMQRVWHIDIPFLVPQIVLSLILGMGNVLNVGFEKALLLQNTLNQSKSEMISTYVYKMGIAAALPDLSYTTAIGLFKSVIAFALVIVVNKIARKYGEMSIW